MHSLHLNNKTIIAISDTHGRHRELEIPPCDIIAHCGDVCNDGNMAELEDFFDWYSSLPARHKLFISGNHDYPFVFEPLEAKKLVPKNVMLMDGICQHIEGIWFYGIASQCNLFEVPELKRQNIDVLLSHVPPQSMLDDQMGCEFLLAFANLQKPKYHIFGHVHLHAMKTIATKDTSFVNACSFA